MKNWLKKSLLIAGIIGTFSFALVGCQPKPPFSNPNPTDILFNGGIVSVVDGHLLFANGYNGDNISTMEDYNNFASSTYLAYTDRDKVNDRYVSPEVGKINSQVTGFSNMYNFVYKQKIYYAAPNTHKTGSNEHVFTYVSFFKSNFGGGDTTELFTTGQYDGANAVVRALKHDNHAYLLVWDGTSDLRCVNLDTSKVILVAEGVTSVAMPRENESEWNGCIYYTKDRDDSDITGNLAYRYDAAKNESTALDNRSGYTISFIGRTEDDVFYTMKNLSTQVTKTYLSTTQKLDTLTITTAGKEFYSSDKVSNIYRVGNNGMENYEGYIFTSTLSGDPQVMYYSLDDGLMQSPLMKKDEFSNILFTYGDLVYYSTSDGIYYKSISTKESKSVVSGMTIIATKVGYDYENGILGNIYFYAQRVYAPNDETPSEERDTNYYLYMKDAMVEDHALLVGKTVK